MEQNLFKSALIQSAIFMLVSIIIVSITFLFIKQFITKKHKIEEFNSAYRVTSAGLIISVFYIMSGIIIPVTSTLKLLQNELIWVYAFDVSKHVSIFILIGMISSFIIYFISIKLISYFSKGVSVFEEIKENNIGMSILVFVILISISLMLKDSIVMCMESFVPYPEMPNLLK